jgi:hypothetical protein
MDVARSSEQADVDGFEMISRNVLERTGAGQAVSGISMQECYLLDRDDRYWKGGDLGL